MNVITVINASPLPAPRARSSVKALCFSARIKRRNAKNRAAGLTEAPLSLPPPSPLSLLRSSARTRSRRAEKNDGPAEKNEVARRGLKFYSGARQSPPRGKVKTCRAYGRGGMREPQTQRRRHITPPQPPDARAHAHNTQPGPRARAATESKCNQREERDIDSNAAKLNRA